MRNYYRISRKPQYLPVVTICLMLLLTATLVWAEPTVVLNTSFEDAKGSSPDGWAKWGENGAWAWY